MRQINMRLTSFFHMAVAAYFIKFQNPVISTTSCAYPGDRFSWLRDNEFARQTLAGVNPVNIELLKVIFITINAISQVIICLFVVSLWDICLPQEFPIRSKLDPTVYGPPESAITKELLEQELGGLSLEKVFAIVL